MHMIKTQLDSLFPDGTGREYIRVDSSGRSPKIDGKLQLQSNAYFYEKFKVILRTRINNAFPYPNPIHSVMPPFEVDLLARNWAYGKFLKEVHDGARPLLLVSLAQSSQASRMMTSRLKQVAGLIPKRKKDFQSLLRQQQTPAAKLANADLVKLVSNIGFKIENRLRAPRAIPPKVKRRLRAKYPGLSSSYLEMEFGWKQLASDVVAVNDILYHRQPHLGFVSRSARTVNQIEVKSGLDIQQWTHSNKVCYTARVSISNPNLLLANQLGTLNFGQAVWDAIPWSFVAGMFVNVNAVLGSLTDFYGFTLDDLSATETLTGLGDCKFSHQQLIPDAFVFSIFRKTKVRRINLVGLPRPELTLRVPEMTWGLAGLASALLLSRLKGVSKWLS